MASISPKIGRKKTTTISVSVFDDNCEEMPA
jgi:hypothetical protein